MLKQSLQQKLGLRINPLQIQLIKLLEIPTYQLEQRIKEELESNPMLEEGEEQRETTDYEQEEPGYDEANDDNDNATTDDEFSIEDYISDDDEIPGYRLSASNTSRDDEARDFTLPGGISFRESLLAQLGLQHLDEMDRKVAEYIIGNIDDDGYLRRDLENIEDDLAFGAGITVTGEKLLALLQVIQHFDPAGVGARDLRECLLLQLRRKGNATPALRNARAMLEECFDEFSRKHYERVAKRLKIEEAALKEAIDEVLKLNPKPGGGTADLSAPGAEKIIPDFLLDIVDGELQLTLNSGDLPVLRVNKAYLHLLEKYREGHSEKERREAASFVKYKLTSARSFIEAVEQRNNTLMATMTAIVQFQKAFFLTGDENRLKPMILRDIADLTGLDISTISRVSNSKHVQTWFGIYSLKRFFSGSMTTSSGEEVSTGEIKNALKELVDGEDKHKPLTDDELADLLNARGYQIARRTIAKYRQVFDIPVARLRREV
ncbi:MAG: RNA polymerase factor sigma-54 [Odoribacteraceae bacterium]|nr:RNA polymerase factor sigma-54 [Odoribacteraceae bacterium]